jgi:hypothetical protein
MREGAGGRREPFEGRTPPRRRSNGYLGFRISNPVRFGGEAKVGGGVGRFCYHTSYGPN